MSIHPSRIAPWFALLTTLGACSSSSSDPAATGNTSTMTGGNGSSGGSAALGGGSLALGGTHAVSGGATGNGGSSATFGGASATGGDRASGGSAASSIGGGGGKAAIGGAGPTGGFRPSGGSGGASGGSGGSTTRTSSAGAGGNPGGGTQPSGGTATTSGGGKSSGGSKAGGGTSGGVGGTFATGGMNGTAGSSATKGNYPFPQNAHGTHCTYPRNANASDVVAAYEEWKAALVTSDGAGGYLRVKKPDSGTVIGSTVSEGIGYGMLLAVYMGDQEVFDNLWLYEQSHLDANGLMNWEIGPDNKTTSGGSGAATDGDEDMAFALVMAARQWGSSPRLQTTYLEYAKELIDLIWQYEVDQTRGYMLKPGDQWGNLDVTNPSYFAPAYYRVFGEVTGKTDDWIKVVDSSYSIIAKSLNATSGNQDNGLVPAWCNSSGTPVEAYSGAPLYFQNDSTRTPFRVGQDYCYFGEPRAAAYLAKISAFYANVGVDAITNGYNLDGTPHPEKDYGSLQAASFVGPAAVGAMSDLQYQQFIDDAYAKVATLNLSAGTIYYQKSWTALSLLMLTGNFVVLGAI